MKVDRTRLKKSASDIPPECQILIDKLRLCSRAVLLEELSRIETWTFGKCELYHWIDILDTFDVILEEACARQIDNEWALVCDVYFTNDNKKLLLWVLHFTTLLIEHSFSRHLYNSMEHLVSLLSSSDMQIVLGVLNLLYMFSKRSNFITRLNSEKRQTLLIRLFYLAESWGGKDNGFGLADCCKGVNTVPQSASTLHFEFYEEKVTHNQTSPLRYIHIESVDKLDKTPAEIMNELVQQYRIPQDKQMRLFTQLRLACCFADYKIRMYCVQARLQALSVLVYSNALTDNLNPHVLLYNGLLEELVELLKLQLPHLVEIRSAALRTLTSIIHLDRNPKLRSIIDVTGASSYHGFLPTLVRQCISTLIGQPAPSFPLPLATALFSFLYHLASYDSGGKALKVCGMMEALLRVIKWPGTELDHITFVTRAVRVIDLITNIDMQAFQTHGGLNSFITRLHMEINYCRTEQPFEIAVPITTSEQKQIEDIRDQLRCLPQRAALLKSMLNFLKKAIQESTFAESIRHVMEGTLPSSLKHIISNAEYYGPSLFLLATDVVTVYVFQEPGLLSSLQDNGLTDVVLHALLIKDVPATREVLASLPNVFSALCLNSRGLDSFVRCRPFDRLFKVLLSPSYLTAMRRRRSADPMGDTATNLGNAMDELMRHQPTLKVDAMTAIISLLLELNYLGTDPKYVCWRAQNKCDVSPVPSQSQTNSTEGGSSDEEEDDEEEASTSSHNHREDSTQDSTAAATTPSNNEKTPIALVDYIVNVTKFVDAILSNNSTDDHCKEFVAQEGLRPLLRILRLPNLPVDYPITVAAQSVASVCKSILNLAHEPRVLTLGLTQLLDIVENLKSLKRSRSKSTTGSVLLNELANAPCLETAFSSYTATPLLHTMGEAHGYVVMFVHVCRTGQSDIRNLSLQYWGSEVGLEVLRGLAELYTTLVWESTLLLALCSDDIIPEGCDFGREDMEKLIPSDIKNDDSSHDESSCSLGMTSAMEALSTTDNMEIDHESVATQTEQREERVSPTSQQLKYIKPLLGASSRLGRALAELFGLLVKLCVGSQARSRRGQNNPVTSTIPSGAARRVATALNVLLTQGMSWNSLPPSPIPKFRLTFLICSVGFTSPMLFDEKRYPYHLMLCKFMNLGGQQAFFDTFKWALSGGGQFSLEEGFEHPDLPDGTGEFLDVWLMLLEKMVNPTALLESPNVCYTKQTNPNQKSIPQGPKIDFDPLKYLIHIQKAAFECVMLMWGRKPLKTYGARMTESILSILRHILQGEKVIKDALAKRANDKTKSTDMGTDDGNVRTDQINQDHLQLLMDMGFTMEMCTEALLNTHSFEQATDYLLNNPNIASRGAEMELGEDDQIVKAIAMSLGEIPAQETPKENPPPEDDTPLDSELIDNFANNVLPVCLDLLDQLPDSVYSVCELIFALAKRNGDTYRHKIVHSIVCEIVDKIFLLLNTGSDKSLHTLVNALIKSETGSQVAVRLHLLALIIDSPTHKEMKIPCGLAINREGLLQILVKLLIGAEQALTDAPKELLTCTPKWLSPLLLVLDLTDKVARQTFNKARMHEATTSKWQWYDMAVGKWNAYSYHNNVVIDAAYWKGEPTVRVTCGRRRYTLQFTDMVQVSDETGNTRPIMMTIVNMQKKQTAKTGEEDMEAEEQSTEQQQRPLEQRTRIVKGIDQAKTRLVTRSCVRLMRLPLDIETLHAVMRVLLRYTRDFENAKLFAEEGGIRLLLDLTLASNFTGFESIATLLIRHVFEGPSVMEMTMEKVLRAKSAANFPPECRELVYLSRHLGSAIARDSDTFTELAKRIWFPDLSMDMAKRNEDNPPKEIFVKSKACARNQQEAEINEIVTVRAIEDLMIALAKPDAPLSTPSPANNATTTASTSNTKSTSSTTPRNYLIPRIMQNELSPLVETTNDEDIVTLPGRKPKETPNITTKLIEDESKKPLIRKSDILRILSDAVRSYIIVGKYITFFVYKPEHSELITEEMTAMTFLLDKLLPSTDNASDPDRHTLTRMLISSIAACHQMPETQLVLIWDVRNSLLRAVGMPESAEKHIQMQMIASLISTIIEHCPPLASLQMKTRFHVHPLNYLNMTHMIRLILRRGIVADLARFTHCIDLSSPHLAATINAALKPLDILTRVLNQPLPPLKVPRKVNNVNDGGPSISQSGATGSENTHAQREDAVGEDADNTEADLSTAGESLGGRAEADEREGVEAALVDIMGQILDQDQNERSNTGNSALNDTMDIDEEPFLDRNDTEESESESNSSGEDDDEDDDDNDDDNGQHVNNEESSAYEDDTEPETEFFEDDLLRMLPAFERNDEDILMIQYSDQNSETDRPTRRFHWNSSGFTTMPFGMQFQESTPPNHPLLINRHNSENSNIPGTRGQRASRQRRLQYLQLNPMNPPQIILQRLLGPYPDPIYSPISGVDDTPRVVIMDQNFGIFSNEEEQIDVVDQSGYLLGPHLSGGLNNVPIALYWWNEESRMCDGSAVLDSAMYFSNVMYAHLDSIRTADLAERKILKRMTSDTSAATSTSKSTSSSTTEKSNVMENLLNAVISDLPPSQRSTSTSTNDPCLVSSDMLSQRSQNSADMLDINDLDIPMVTDQSISNYINCNSQNEENAATQAASASIPLPDVALLTATADVGTNPVDTLTDHSIRSPPPLIRIDFRDPCFPHPSLPLVTSSPFDSLDSVIRSFVHPTMFGDEPNTDSNGDRILTDSNDRPDDDAEIETQPTVRQIAAGTILTSSVGTSTTPALDDYLSETTFPPPPYSIIEITTGSDTATTGTVTTVSTNTVTCNSTTVTSVTSTNSQEGYRPNVAPPSQDITSEIVVEAVPPPTVQSEPSTEFNFTTNTSNTTPTPTSMATASAPPLSDLELPEDVDPSFLAALPEEMRAEVIAEQLRLQRIRRRAAQQDSAMASQSTADLAAASSSTAPASNSAPDISEVSPDFLAALPPAIQEEVLAQQRLEQQRQMAAAANPNDPVDAAAFFQILHPALRQDILTDMEESQISVLPPDLAAEAQTLRRDWEARNRQLMQERFLSQIAQSNNALSSMLRRSTIYPTSRGPRYIHPVTQRNPHWSSWGPSFPARNTEQRQMRNTVVRVRGRQLLDLESISCLLVLLFQNNPKIHVLRFYRCMRNFCYHGPTRDWVIKALLSILDKCVNAKPIDTTGSNQSLRRSKRLASKVSGECTSQNWLNINLEAALGCKTNVFIVNKGNGGTSKKGEKKTNTAPSIDIHHQAALIAARQTLDLLIQLAKSFPSCFLPLRVKSGNKKKPIPPKNKSTKSVPDFWDLLLKLDSTKPPTPIKKYRFPPRTYANIPGPDSDWNFASTFETSGFGQLLTMLDAPTVKKNSQLVDKFLRLLYMITRGLPELPQYLSGNKHIVRFRYIEKYESIMNYEDKLRIIVNTITWKRCSEDGLDCATLMLHNLSHVSDEMRKTVINLLWYGAFVLSRVVDTHIKALLNELQRMKEQQPFGDDESRLVMTSNSTGGANSTGILNDRFTKEPIIVTASTKQRSTCDLQLSSMSQLVSKNSSQAYFLKLLRVIVQVLDTKKKTDNKDGAAAGPSATSTKTDDTTAMEVSTDPGPSQASTSTAPPSTKEIPISSTSPATYMDSKLFEDKPLSAMLSLGNIWQTLSKCLLELEHTPDHHAVLVLQPAVEAFFLVHTTPKSRIRRQTYVVDDGPTLNSIFETTVDIPNEEENIIVPPLSPIQVNTVVDLLYSSDSDETRVYDSNSTATENNTTATPATTEEQSNNSEQQQTLTSSGETTVVPSTSDLEVPESLISRYEALAYEKMAASGGLPCFMNDMDISDDFMTSTEQDLQSGSSSSSSSQSLTPSDPASMDDKRKFVAFAERHRTVLNQILRQSTGNLADGPFAVLVDHTRILDFDVKRRYFRSELERLDNGIRREELAVHVRRSHVFEDSFRELYRRSAEEWKNRFYIVFEEEEGQDAGGLLREWYMIISRDIFNPMYALFTVSPGDRVTYMINSSSYCNPNHLCYYKFVGRVIAKAIYDNKLLECYFTRSFYKHILGKQVKYTDMESEDYSFYKGLVYLMEHDVADLGYDLTFSTEVQEFGVTNVRDLIPNGSKVPVNEDNKMEYIRLVCQMKMTVSIQKQLNAFLEGFYDIIPKRLISIFNEQELELLISGLPNIDIDDLKNNTEYHKYQANSLQIQWFWRALRSFDQADRAKFLQFVTGTSKVPLQGFGSLEGMNGVQKFQIHRDDRSTDRLPSAHTCFNQLDLPVYETYDKLRMNLLKAIQECSEGFGFA
ncbi:E3 ubiquitin-protein ligase HUWE1 isoform X4 [Chrysoperla carnea]|uniref:E3 ubiquitin-protein ligase HUWE1 isoform X4 n=1 Tax=Chrysoperla carnea TaxID=189513 RepID=UPI001D07C579|nr:E3 ubiquitin-protein ligase HUWE1 isoform X4 [Chrysoperla carnea]